MIVFRILSGGKAGKIVQSDLDVLYIGRKPECILQLDPYQDLSVHGQHAKVYSFDGCYHLEDLDTKNGTFVDNEPLKVPIQLRQGMIFRLGLDGPEIEVYDCKASKQEVSPTPNNFQLKRLDTDTIYNFYQKSVRIGRQFDCELSLDPIKNREVSGYHAIICYKENGYYLDDLQSANGTFLNNFPSQNNKLKHGDIIQLGKDGPEFEFIYDQFLHDKTQDFEDERKEDLTNKEIPENIIVKEQAPLRQNLQKKKNEKSKELFLDKLKEKKRKYLQKIKEQDYYTNFVNSKLGLHFNHYKKQISLAITIIIFAFILLYSFSSKNFDEKAILEYYQDNIVSVYCRYLIEVDGKLLRGQFYSCGFASQQDGQITVIGNRTNIYPWEKNKKSTENKLIHIISVWANNESAFNERIPNFFNSYNNNTLRVGGIGVVAIEDFGKLYKLSFAMKNSTISNKASVSINNDFDIKSETKVYCLYMDIDDGNKKKVKTSSIGLLKQENFPSEAILFNVYGECIGVFSQNEILKLQ